MPPGARFVESPSTDPVALCQEFETLEFQCAARNLPHPQPAAHIICLILTEELSEARFLWRRLPPVCKEDNVTDTAWKLGKALWLKDYSTFFSTAVFAWPPNVAPLVVTLVEQIRENMVKMIRKAYQVISIARMTEIMGLDRQGALSLADRLGWKVCGEYVEVTPGSTVRNLDAAGVELKTLTEQLVRLQTNA